MAPSHEDKAAFGHFLSEHAKSRIVVTSHRKADIDGLACAYAISRQLPHSIIAMDELDEGAKGLAGRLAIDVKAFRELKRKDYSGLLVVDTAAYTLLEPAKEWKILLVIDHHHPQGRDMKAGAFIIDDKSPSSAEIVAELISGITKDKDASFALACAIISDTARFKAGRAETFGILAKLMDSCAATYHELLEIAEPEHRSDVKMAVLKACQRVNVIYSGGLVIATSEVGSNESDAAQFLSDIADVAFVASWKDRERETRISARARKCVTVPLNEVMKDVGVSLGGNGGGHPKAAGATVKAHTPEALKACVDALISRMENPVACGQES